MKICTTESTPHKIILYLSAYCILQKVRVKEPQLLAVRTYANGRTWRRRNRTAHYCRVYGKKCLIYSVRVITGFYEIEILLCRNRFEWNVFLLVSKSSEIKQFCYVFRRLRCPTTRTLRFRTEWKPQHWRTDYTACWISLRYTNAGGGSSLSQVLLILQAQRTDLYGHSHLSMRLYFFLLSLSL